MNEREKLVKVIETLKAMDPHNVQDEAAADAAVDKLLEQDVTITILGYTFTTAPSVELLETFIKSAENDLYNYDAVQHGHDQAKTMNPGIQIMY